MRANARRIFLAAVAAADPYERVRAAIEISTNGALRIAGHEVAREAAVRIFAVGKAALPMACAALDAIPPRLVAAPPWVLVHDETSWTPPPEKDLRVSTAGHPVPDERGSAFAASLERSLRGLTADTAVLCLLSGGGSALLVAPSAGLTLEDKIETTRRLLECGATIEDVNAVRKHLSRLKGGGLARAAQPALVESLILSDVVGDDLSSIASGPTAPDPTTFADALGIVDRHRIRERLPASVIRHLESGVRGEIPETAKEGDSLFSRVHNRIVGGSRQSVEAAAEEAAKLGYAVEIVDRALRGEAREAGARLARLPERLSGATALLAAGETTVTVHGTGTGGRNQELALAFAVESERRACRGEWAFLSGGTDGRDGPTDAAGAVVDRGTLSRARRAGRDPLRSLQDNDSHALLRDSGDLLVTGATGTNVADLQVLLVDP